MGLFRSKSERKGEQNEFKPEDRERSLVDPWIDDREIPFIGRGEETGLRDLIMGIDGIDEDRKLLLVDWAQGERGRRARPGGERTGF